jgi:hypothetical protein
MHGQQDFLHHVFDIVRPKVQPFAQQRPQMSGQILQKHTIRRGVTFQRAVQQGSEPFLDWPQRSGVRLARHVDLTPRFDSGRARAVNSRNRSRARESRDMTVPTGMSSTSAHA